MAMTKPYEKLLSRKRLRPSTRPEEELLKETESDRSRVIYSAAFRRLQRKTQVFPLEENAAVRSRLTHSLEVAHVGRYLTTSVFSQFGRDKAESLGLTDDSKLAMTNIVETACLLHDIGNPPFGHFGEAAISNWYTDYVRRASEYRATSEAHSQNIKSFDGNPQGFRVITKLAGADGSTGMNLTVSQIASTVKYPCTPSGISDASPLTKKAGIFTTEAAVWECVKQELQMSDGSRFPLAYLMEAADDISYCLSDIEDGIEKGLLTHELFTSDLVSRLDKHPSAQSIVKTATDNSAKYGKTVEAAVVFRSELVRFLVQNAASVYVQQHDQVLAGTHKGLVERGSDSGNILSAIKKSVGHLLYGKRSSHERELVGHAAIKGILSKFECVLKLDRDNMGSISGGGRCSKNLEEEMRLFSLLAGKHVAAYRKATEDVDDEQEHALRVHLIVDFVAGMTDIFALRTYQTLAGISL
ncbi:dGTPase [Tahibacter soli]|uniref:DGTPase n=1 Tax=Tahibacter soli TaxID=2983605 RepID=A0A9X4BFF2_9GAMM|nr:dGTPase [Tahibacter soli]MDC8010965.1 dGTPase [Tahibacter soli]